MDENPVCEGCKHSRKFPAPYAVLCDYPWSRQMRMRGEKILECDKREAK